MFEWWIVGYSQVNQFHVRCLVSIAVLRFWKRILQLPDCNNSKNKASFTVWPQPILSKVSGWWQIPPQHQRTYLGGPESIEITPFRPHFIRFQKKFFLDQHFFFQEQKKSFQETVFVQFFMYWKAKENFGAIRKFLKIFIFGSLHHNKGLKGGF